MGSIDQATPPAWTIKDEPIENHRAMKVRVIGAGFSGIYLGVRISQRLRNIDLQIYEKNDNIGGVWWENRYPGCACDIPAHSYQYSFEPNANWSGFYAESTEICEYLHGVAAKYGVTRFVKTHHKVTECTWDDKSKKWQIAVTNTAKEEALVEEADFVIAAKGALNDPAWPEIIGLEDFTGELMHSAKWNQDYDFKNKKIGLIGGGSSGIQILPKLQKTEGAQVSVFIRNKTWVSIPFGEMVMRKLGLDPDKLQFTDEQRTEFASDHEAYLKFRKTIEVDGNECHAATQKGSEMQAGFVKLLREVMAQRLATKPEILAALAPSFGVGCRRLTPGPGYLEALVSDNVKLVTEEITRINATGIELKDGEHIDLDMMACATGFQVSGAPPFTITGKSGATIEQKFQPFPQTYMSVAIDDFPNYFMMLGPNSGIGAGSLTVMVEAQGDYIVKCIRKLQKEDYITMTPKRARVLNYSQYVGEYFKRTVYMDDCKSWYKGPDGKGERITALYPGSLTHAIEMYRAPRWEDYEYECVDDNELRWVGNGWSQCQIDGDQSYYLNPEIVDVPPAGEPENDPKLKLRPFSH